ncbi:MAG: stage 0 sporulation family protein [Geobacteraceae bacterium]|nr:stage 0 sporulation family protein [Geobacteraceae bacterium]
MIRIVKIQFHSAEKLYDFNAGTVELKQGDKVIVETDRGRSMAIVATAPAEVPEEVAPESLKSILRKASPADLEAAERNTAREKETHVFCQNKIAERNLDMKLVKVEYAFDGSKAVFYFTADGRIDFRDLVKDLAQHFHTRIEMRQIGVRDEAKIVGGLGICGRELCCSSFLRDFAPVSVKMAKEQNLALNPTKISGQCGRLLCCLGYEFETYCELRKGLPKCGKHMKCGNAEGEVVKVNTLARSYTIRTPDQGEVICRLDEAGTDHVATAAPPPAPPRENPRQAQQKRQEQKKQEQKKPEQKKPEQRIQEQKQPEPKQPVVEAGDVKTEKEKSGSTGRRRNRNRNRNRNKQEKPKETP